MNKDAKRLFPGDPVGGPVLTRADGERVNLGHQTRAGRPAVLTFGSRGALERLATANGRHIEALTGTDSAYYAVAVEESGTAAGDLFLDPKGTLAHRLTGAAEGIAVLSPPSRLAAVFPLDRFPEAAALAMEFHMRAPERRAVMQAPVLLIDQVLEPDLCEETLAYWETGEKVANAVSQGSGRDVAEEAAKRRTDVIVRDGELFEKLKNRLEHRVLPEMYKAFRTRIASMEALRIGCYDAAGHGAFERHRDNTTPQTAHRGFAISLNLNSGYEGGGVRFPEYDSAQFVPEAGAALIFSCALLHEALPVTGGKRFAMFSFLNDAVGAAHERRRMERAQREGSRLLPGLGG